MRTGLTMLKLAAAVAVVASVSVAMAQPGGGGGRGRGRGGFGGGVSPLVLIQNETVQKDLEVTDDQKTKLTSVVDELQQAARGQGRGAGGAGGAGGAPDIAAIQQRQREQRKEQVKKIDEVLVKQQADRFDQILLQAQGAAAALRDPDVQDKLSMTADQKQKETDLASTYQQKRQDLFQAGGGGGPPDQAEIAKLTTEENDKAKDALTGDQKTKFDSLLGKKIDIDFASLRGGRGGGGGFGGGGGGRGRRGGGGGAGGAAPGA